MYIRAKKTREIQRQEKEANATGEIINQTKEEKSIDIFQLRALVGRNFLIRFHSPVVVFI